MFFEQGMRLTGIDTLFTESAFISGEIDNRVAGTGFFDDVSRAVYYAVTAPIAYLKELRFRNRPGRA